MTTNQTRFAEVYTEELRRAVEANTTEYFLMPGDTPASYTARVAPKMIAAFLRGSANKDGTAAKATCKRLGIPFTYTALRAYLAEGR